MATGIGIGTSSFAFSFASSFLLAKFSPSSSLSVVDSASVELQLSDFPA